MSEKSTIERAIEKAKANAQNNNQQKSRRVDRELPRELVPAPGRGGNGGHVPPGNDGPYAFAVPPYNNPFLLEDHSGIALTDIIRALWSRRGLFASVGLILATLLVLANPIIFPDKYEAEAAVRVKAFGLDDDTITARTFAIVPTEVLSNRVLTKVIDDLELTKRDQIPLIEQALLAVGITPNDNAQDPSGIVRWLRDSVRINQERVGMATAVFTISLRDENPEVASILVNKIADTYIEMVHTFDASDSKEAVSFLASRVALAKEAYEKASDALTEYQTANSEFLIPDETIETNIATLQRQYGESIQRSEQMKELNKRLLVLLEDEPRYVSSGAAAPTSSISGQLQELRAQLAQAKTVYLDSHPVIADLERKIAALGNVREGSRSAGGGLVPNPEYANLRQQIANNEAEFIVLDRQLPLIEEKIMELSRHLSFTKSAQSGLLNVQSEWDRTYTDLRELREQYNEYKLKSEAQAGESGKDLDVLDYAAVPTLPVTASRTILMVLGVMVGFGLAFMLVLIKSALDRWQVPEGEPASAVTVWTGNIVGFLWFVALFGYILVKPYL